jgi:hypothetical protein
MQPSINIAIFFVTVKSPSASMFDFFLNIAVCRAVSWLPYLSPRCTGSLLSFQHCNPPPQHQPSATCSTVSHRIPLHFPQLLCLYYLTFLFHILSSVLREPTLLFNPIRWAWLALGYEKKSRCIMCLFPIASKLSFPS